MGTPYLKYRPQVDRCCPKDDPTLLEETQAGKLETDFLALLDQVNPQALSDLDSDGKLEIKSEDFEQVYSILTEQEAAQNYFKRICNPPLQRVFPLATYFDDRQNIDPLPRFRDLGPEMISFTQSHDFEAAQEYFLALYLRTSSLEFVAEDLARHLSASAIHTGEPFDGTVLLEGLPGFSTTREGYLRFNCSIFVQLAHSDLAKIPDLKFTFVFHDQKIWCAWGRGCLAETIGESQPEEPASFLQAVKEYWFSHVPISFKSDNVVASDHQRSTHITLIVSDEGGHLVVDNDRVNYLPDFLDPIHFIQKRWESSGYNRIYTDSTFLGVMAKAGVRP